MSLVWGVSYLFIKVAVEEVSVPLLVFSRTAGGAIALLPFIARRGWATALDDVRRHWRWILAFCALEMLGPWFLLSSAEQKIDSSLAGLIIAGVPILAVLVGWLLGDREHIGPVRWAGLLLGLLGVGVLAVPELSGGEAFAVGQMALVVLGYSTAPRILAHKLGGVPGLTVAGASLAMAGVIYLPFALLTWPSETPSPGALGSMAALAIVSTALAFVAFFGLIAEAGPTRAMVFTYVNPAVAVIAGVLILDEKVTAAMVLAFPLIIAGSVLATRQGRPQTPAPA